MLSPGLCLLNFYCIYEVICVLFSTSKSQFMAVFHFLFAF